MLRNPGLNVTVCRFSSRLAMQSEENPGVEANAENSVSILDLHRYKKRSHTDVRFDPDTMETVVISPV